LVICFILLLCGLFWLQVASKAWMLFLFAVIYGSAVRFSKQTQPSKP
jgi:hypothetical protein